MKARQWYAHGKLLITGEYLVMHGVKALAVPISLGQSLKISPDEKKTLSWKAEKPGGLWFQTELSLPDLQITDATDDQLSNSLISILSATRKLNPDFLKGEQGYRVKTMLEFDTEYGFGSSSTLISNLAAWAEVDAYELQRETFGGSGYDIACALHNGPIIYQLNKEKPVVTNVTFRPVFSDQLYFVYLGNKQKSTQAISEFKSSARFSQEEKNSINTITEEMISCQSLDHFQQLVSQHEMIMSSVLQKPTIKSILFDDFDGSVKSLGAWGGDFVLLTSRENYSGLKDYLLTKGLSVIYKYNDLVLG